MSINPLVDLGVYYFRVTLSDQNVEPESQKYQFRIDIKQLLIIVPEVEEQYVFNITLVDVIEEKDETPTPGFRIEELTYIGELTIAFTQGMIKVDDLSLFT